MNRLLKVCISAVLAQVLFISVLNAQEIIFTDSFENCPPANRVDWDGGGDGVSWSDPLNWEGDVLPVEGNSVSIRAFGKVTVVYDSSAGITNLRCIDSSESLSVTGGELGIETGWVSPGLSISHGTLSVAGNLQVAGTLDLSGGHGILDGTGTVTVAGLFTWSGGRQVGSGETVANGGMVSVSSGSERFLRARTLTLNAASTIGGTYAQRFWDAATINNNAPLDIQSDVDLSHYTGAVSTFNNNSTVTKSAGSDVSLITANFNNSGTVTVDSGELHVGYVNSTGSSSGNYVVASGATLGVSGANTMNGAFTGAGSFHYHAGGTTQINGMYTLSGTLTVSSGSSNTLRFAASDPLAFTDDVTVTSGILDFTSTVTEIDANIIISGGTLTSSVALPVTGALTLSGGILDGTGTMTVTGLFTWSGGRQYGSGATVANGGMVSSGVTRYLRARTLTLNAASTIGGTGAQSFWDAATLNNNAPLVIQSDVDLSHYTGAVSTFNNNSTVTKSAGSDVSLITANFNNDGTVTVDSGELHVGHGTSTGSSSGNYIVASGATLGVSGANTMNGTFTGAGNFHYHAGGTTQINSMYTLGGTLTVSSGSSNTLRFEVPVTFSNDVTISSGVLEYTKNPTAINADVIMSGGTLETFTDMSVTGSWTQSNGILDGATTVTVTGLFTWSGGRQYGPGSTVANGGMVSPNPSGMQRRSTIMHHWLSSPTWTCPITLAQFRPSTTTPR